MSSARRREQRLATLWRLRQLELEQARIERAGLEAVADRQRRRVAQMRREVDETRELERVRVTAETGVTADLLRGARAYAAWQIRGVVEQEAALRASERVAEQSRLEVGRRFERLEVIQRLRDRNA